MARKKLSLREQAALKRRVRELEERIRWASKVEDTRCLYIYTNPPTWLSTCVQVAQKLDARVELYENREGKLEVRWIKRRCA